MMVCSTVLFYAPRQRAYVSALITALAGRIKELINRGGEKISPIEVRLGDVGWIC